MAMTDRIEDLEDKSFNPYLADEVIFGDLHDPYPRLTEMLAEAPVLRGSYSELMGIPSMPNDACTDNYMVLSFAAVDQVLNDPATFSNEAFAPTLGAAFGHTVSMMDPPEHTKYRRILQQAFRPNIVQEWGTGIVAPVVDELIGAFRDTGKAELREQFARPYPFNVIDRRLVFPAEDIAAFYKLTLAQIMTFLDIGADTSAKLGRYFTRMLH